MLRSKHVTSRLPALSRISKLYRGPWDLFHGFPFSHHRLSTHQQPTHAFPFALQHFNSQRSFKANFSPDCKPSLTTQLPNTISTSQLQYAQSFHYLLCPIRLQTFLRFLNISFVSLSYFVSEKLQKLRSQWVAVDTTKLAPFIDSLFSHRYRLRSIYTPSTTSMVFESNNTQSVIMSYRGGNDDGRG